MRFRLRWLQDCIDRGGYAVVAAQRADLVVDLDRGIETVSKGSPRRLGGQWLWSVTATRTDVALGAPFSCGWFERPTNGSRPANAPTTPCSEPRPHECTLY